MMQMNDGRLLRFRLLNCTYKKSTIYAQQISLCTAYKKTFLTHFILHFGACTPFLAELGWQAVRQCPVESPAVHHHHHHHHQCTTVFSIRVLIAHWKEGKQFSIKTSAATAILSENEHSLPFSSPFPPSLHFSLDDQRLQKEQKVRLATEVRCCSGAKCTHNNGSGSSSLHTRDTKLCSGDQGADKGLLLLLLLIRWQQRSGIALTRQPPLIRLVLRLWWPELVKEEKRKLSNSFSFWQISEMLISGRKRWCDCCCCCGCCW